MLNRTNRTLSANSNRLNLGTRSLALFQGVNIGTRTLRIRHAHPVPVQTAQVGSIQRHRSSAPIFMEVGKPMPPMGPGSSPRRSWLTPSRASWAEASPYAEAYPATPVEVVCDDDRPWRAGDPARANFAPVAAALARCARGG